MKHVQLTVLKNDVNAVVTYLGHHEVMHFGEPEAGALGANSKDETHTDFPRLKVLLDRLRPCAEFLGVPLPSEPAVGSSFPSSEEESLIEKICDTIDALAEKEKAAQKEKYHIEEAFNEAIAFSSLNAPLSDLDHLSYLTLRVGHLDPVIQPELKQRLENRAVVIPLGEEGSDRILAASSRKGRFALDSELKQCGFESIPIPEGYRGIPAELIGGLEERLSGITKDIEKIDDEKTQLRNNQQELLRHFASLLLTAIATEQLKSRFVSTSSIYMLSGWIPADMISRVAADLSELTGGRTAIRVYAPHEIPAVRDGGEKVPVSLKHGPFVRGFQGMVFSYGVPPYGTIDPTPLVAFFYTFLFGIMFGDVGHGFVLFLAGLLTLKRGPLRRFNSFSTPLIAVGAASMIMGLLAGSVFTNEELLVGPTMYISAALTGHPVDRILHILPLAEKGGSITKLFYLFGFTVGLGVIMNSLGLFINLFNCFRMKKYQAALFAKTGVAGLLFFWYALFIAIRCLLGGQFETYDYVGLAIPAFLIFIGPIVWRAITGKKPLMGHSLGEFIMEGVMEVWETASGYFSNTASFLRVGAFALSHAVLAYVVFFFTEEMIISMWAPIGYFWATVLMLIGNSIIIVLEGLVVAVQVMRLQYYEFFSKFFTERGVAFVPFRFRKS
jgi:V/A-type H+-transporting ATPase subunit I